MGVMHVDVTIRNPAEPARSWEGRFLVDTGAIDSLVPRRHLEAIGLKLKGRRVYETADGREVEMDVMTADIEVMGEITAGLIVVGDADAEPMLGVTALKSVGIEVDPQNQRLKKLPAVRLKGLRRERRTLRKERNLRRGCARKRRRQRRLQDPAAGRQAAASPCGKTARHPGRAAGCAPRSSSGADRRK